MTEEERVNWCYSFETSKRWFTALTADKSGSKHTEREYSRALKTFCQWMKKNPDQLIAERKEQRARRQRHIKQALLKPKKTEDCKDGNCQKIIEETELQSHMQNGWRFVSALPSGKIVITNE